MKTIGRLSSDSIKGTISAVSHDFIFLSPGLGQLILSSQSLLANLRGCAKGAPSGLITKELFHQRSDKTGLRYGPISTSKSKSQPIFWLSPEDIGTIVGMAISNEASKERLSSGEIDRILKTLGIECNYVRGVWSGISLQRFRQLVWLLAKDFKDFKSMSTFGISTPNIFGLSFSVISASLWESSTNKSCLLQYMLAVEKISQQEIIRNNYSNLRTSGSEFQRNWLEARITAQDLDFDSIHQALTRLLNTTTPNPIQSYSNPHDDDTFGHSLELLIASIVQEYSFKPAIRLGQYSRGDGKLKPDCVEVVIREIIDTLIFNSRSQSMDPNRLPHSAHPSVRRFYTSLAQGELQAVSSPRIVQKNSDHAQSLVADYGIKTHVGEGNEAGREWFRICSEVEGGCSYLSRTSDNLPYELRPSLANVSRALGLLLNHQLVDTSSPAHSDRDTPTYWKSMKDLEDFWNRQLQLKDSHQSGGGGNTEQGGIRVNVKNLSFRAPLSDTEKISREICHISFLDPAMAFELECELEEAHGLASVKFLPARNNKKIWNGRLYQRVLESLAPCSQQTNHTRDRNSILGLNLIQSVLLSDNMLLYYLNNPYNLSHSGHSSSYDLLRAILSTRWGEERRGAVLKEDGNLEVISASFSNSLRDLEKEKTKTLYTRALHELVSYLRAKLQYSPSQEKNAHNKEENELVAYFIWFLREVPENVHYLSIASALRNLPLAMLSKVEVYNAVVSIRNGHIIWAIISADAHNENFIGHTFPLSSKVTVYFSKLVLQFGLI